MWEKAAKKPTKRPATPARDKKRYKPTAKLTPFHAALPTIIPRTGKEDPRERSVQRE